MMENNQKICRPHTPEKICEGLISAEQALQEISKAEVALKLLEATLREIMFEMDGQLDSYDAVESKACWQWRNQIAEILGEPAK